MNRYGWMRTLATGVLAGCTAWAGNATPTDSSPNPAPCAAAEYHQLDFWAGDWDVFDVDNPATQVARVKVDRILNGCVLHEDYQDTSGHKGQSFSIYDAGLKAWHQSWVTNRGQILLLDGGLHGEQFELNATEHHADGKSKLIRGTWKPVEGGVRETAVTSLDEGKTWTPWFDLMFRPHASAPSGTATALNEDQKAVAALDTQYQAAVKVNDAATMDRILADDFLLSTGSGKKYTKADLLSEARGGKVQYEHQEDTDQTVHVWGDTAVITARLWEKGTDNGKPFDYTVWFSDTYVRTANGWVYVFGQSSLPLPKASQ
ncbi:MAG TPA: nuclear transport factor 2 family protein [Terriglobales bacterium]|nr:nuclear transport factor 2 family protein [Terriglobales bacterium]